MKTRPIIIGIVAGESSGDILGAGLIRALKGHLKEVSFIGIGGPCMQLEDMQSWYDITELSVMGFFEVIFKLPRLLRIRNNVIKRFYQLKPNIFIGIDSPDFNITVETALKKHGIHTIHYVSPSIWAWRLKRIFKLKEATDNILVVFPFEKRIYDHFNVSCQFVGHPLADKIPLNPDKYSIRQKLGISNNINCLALLPGSRMQEINRLADDFLKCAKLLTHHFVDLEILVPLCNQQSIQRFSEIAFKFSMKLRIFKNHMAWEIMAAADVSLLAAGTVTLECMLAKCPMVVAYRMNPLTFMLAKRLINIPWISLPNLLSNCNLVTEFIQNDCQPKNLSKTLINLLKNKKQQLILQKKFRQLHNNIKYNADERAAQAVLDLI